MQLLRAKCRDQYSSSFIQYVLETGLGEWYDLKNPFIARKFVKKGLEMVRQTHFYYVSHQATCREKSTRNTNTYVELWRRPEPTSFYQLTWQENQECQAPCSSSTTRNLYEKCKVQSDRCFPTYAANLTNKSKDNLCSRDNARQSPCWSKSVCLSTRVFSPCSRY